LSFNSIEACPAAVPLACPKAEDLAEHLSEVVFLRRAELRGSPVPPLVAVFQAYLDSPVLHPEH